MFTTNSSEIKLQIKHYFILRVVAGDAINVNLTAPRKDFY